MTHLGDFLSRGDLDLFVAANLLAAAAAYGVGMRMAHQRSGRRWPVRRWACFYLAIALLALVTLGPMGAWAHTFFWVHMTQHLVITMAAAPLLVVGGPLSLAVAASGPATRARIEEVLRARWVGWVTNPVVTWLLFAGLLLGVHFSPFYDWALENHGVMVAVEEPAFLLVALLYYQPLIGDNPLPSRPSYGLRLVSLGLMMVPEAVVGAVIYFASVVLYQGYATPRPWGLSPMADQQLSGALMWCLVMVVDGFWMMTVAAQWWSAEERKARALDAAEVSGAEREAVHP